MIASFNQLQLLSLRHMSNSATTLGLPLRSAQTGLFGLQSNWLGAAKSVLLLLFAATVSFAQEPGRIDFRNFILGHLDAPVYESDGVTRLEGDRYTANLMAFCCSFPDTPPADIFNGVAASRFQAGELAGYWLPEIVRISWAAPGDRIWAQVRILDQHPGLDGLPLLVRAVTEPFAVQLGDEPVPVPILSPIILNEFPAVIDLRNHIPGVLDAPIYESDGVTRLEGITTYSVQIVVDLMSFEESGPTSLERIGTSGFQTGDMAGYWFPKQFAVHGRQRDALPGERVWAQIKVFDHWGTVPRGSSEPFCLDLKPSTPLLGLRSFSLEKPPPEIDFRNYIRGLLDAPVYRADGTNRLSGATGCWAELYVGLNEGTLMPLGSLPFGTGERAGYVVSDNPEGGEWTGYVASNTVGIVVLPFARAGDRVWIQMRAWEPHQGGYIPEVIPPARFIGQSEIFSLAVASTPTPLIGLKSFRLQPASITAAGQGERVVLRWSAGDGTVNYDLEEASALDTQDPWRRSSAKPVLEVQHFDWTWVAEWVATNAVSSPAAFYRLKLLNP